MCDPFGFQPYQKEYGYYWYTLFVRKVRCRYASDSYRRQLAQCGRRHLLSMTHGAVKRHISNSDESGGGIKGEDFSAKCVMVRVKELAVCTW
jgi:hypothetical protein